MYAIVCAEKGSYDSDIIIKRLKVEKNQPLAQSALIDFLVEEYLTRNLRSEINEYYSLTEDEIFIKTKEKILEEINKKSEKIIYNNGEEYIKLHYNRVKNLTGYTIPCSTLNEYQGKSVSLIIVN